MSLLHLLANIPLNFTPVLIINGQSNAEGLSGVNPALLYQTPNPLVKIKGYRGSGTITTITDFEVVDFSQGNCLGGPNGIEIYISYYATRPVYIIKVVKGGTNLHTDWGSGSNLRNRLITHINEAKAQLTGLKLKWVNYWNQWEYEVFNQAPCLNYFSNYKAMWDEVTAATGVSPKHLIAQPKPGSNFANNYAENTAIIQEQQQLIVNHYKGALIPATGFGTVDGVHYNQDGHRIMAERVMPYLN